MTNIRVRWINNTSFSLSITTAGGDAPAAAAAPAKAEKPAEEEVDALDGGMDMFGGGGAKTGDY